MQSSVVRREGIEDILSVPSQTEQLIALVNSIPVVNGAVINDKGELVLDMINSAEYNAGSVMGPKGEKGEKGDKGDPGDAASITVDSELSDTSTNPVQNKVLYAYFQQALEALGALQDSIPTEAQINALIDARFVPMTQAEYDALTEVDPNKYYMIVGDSQ